MPNEVMPIIAIESVKVRKRESKVRLRMEKGNKMSNKEMRKKHAVSLLLLN